MGSFLLFVHRHPVFGRSPQESVPDSHRHGLLRSARSGDKRHNRRNEIRYFTHRNDSLYYPLRLCVKFGRNQSQSKRRRSLVGDTLCTILILFVSGPVSSTVIVSHDGASKDAIEEHLRKLTGDQPGHFDSGDYFSTLNISGLFTRTCEWISSVRT